MSSVSKTPGASGCQVSGPGGGAPADAAAKVRPSRASSRRALVLIAVHVLFLLHLGDLALRGETLSPLEPSEAMEFSKSSVLNAGFIFFALLIGSTLVFGRFFCGWGCHIVALQDLCRAMLMKVGVRPRPLKSRLAWIAPTLAATYMFIWPLAYRIYLGDSLAVRHTELQTSSFWETFPNLGIALLTFFVCGFVVVYFLGAKGFCTYGCPYGAIFSAVDHLAPGRIRVTDACEGCGHCTITCSSNVAVSKEVREYGMVVDSGCMKCLDCVSVCPKDALYFGFGPIGLGARPRVDRKPTRWQLSWGEEGLFALLFTVGVLAFWSLFLTPVDSFPFLLSLGQGAVLGFVYLRGVQMFTRPRVRIQQLELKVGGSWTRPGKVFMALLAAFLPIWFKAAVTKTHGMIAEHHYVALDRHRLTWFDANRPTLSAEFEQRRIRLAEHSSAYRRWAFHEGPFNPARRTWAAIFAGELDQARLALAEWKEIRPGFLDAAELEARLDLLEGKPGRARESLTGIVARNPDRLSAVLLLAEILAVSGDTTSAGALLAGTLERHPQHAGLQVAHGTVLTLTGRAPEAISAFRTALEVDPSNHMARERLASLRAFTGDRDEALRVLNEGVTLFPEARDAWLALVRTLAQMGQVPDARAALERARLQAGPNPAFDELERQLR